MYASPSGRYALITTYVNSGQGALFLLWDTTTNTVRELLRVNEAPGWCSTASMCRWDGDEEGVRDGEPSHSRGSRDVAVVRVLS